MSGRVFSRIGDTGLEENIHPLPELFGESDADVDDLTFLVFE